MFWSLILIMSVVLTSVSSITTAQDGARKFPELSLRSGETVTVIGIYQGKHQLRKKARKRLQDRRIGFGLTTLLAEVLFDTGNFRLQEEKDIQQRELLEDFVSRYWIEPGQKYTEQDLHHVAAQLSAKLLAYGRVTHARASGRRISLGPLSRNKQKLRIQVQVCLYDAATRTRFCRDGKGEAQQEASGVIYTFHGDHIAFTKNATGKATKQAMVFAVQKLMASIHLIPLERRAQQP